MCTSSGNGREILACAYLGQQHNKMSLITITSNLPIYSFLICFVFSNCIWSWLAKLVGLRCDEQPTMVDGTLCHFATLPVLVRSFYPIAAAHNRMGSLLGGYQFQKLNLFSAHILQAGFRFNFICNWKCNPILIAFLSSTMLASC